MKVVQLLSRKKIYILAGFLALIAALIFLLCGQSGLKLGFPLDDAWIHQTYARNLITQKVWSYSNGVISGGSTSPLWTLIISAGYLFSHGIIWTLFISVVVFLLLILISVKIFTQLLPSTKIWQLLIAATLLILEWHLLWACVSGMETLLFSLVIILLMDQLLQKNPKWGVIGLLSGLLPWIRPDGLTLLGPVFLVLFLQLIQKRGGKKEILFFICPFIIIFGGYLVFNQITSGHFLPNTFYAKQTEYHELLQTPLMTRIFSEFSQIITGSGVLILPGFLFSIFWSVKKKQYGKLSIILWIIGFVILYAWRLPVTYQHGRYVIPVIAPFMILGLDGMNSLLKEIMNVKTNHLLSFSWYGSLLALSVVFYILGINSYRSDLQIVNKLMVEPAQWVSENINNGDLIAVHDIGAMGYYTKNPMLDLAGLINPEVIPFMNDDQKIFSYMREKNTKYFIGFSDWYKNSSQWGQVIAEFSGNYQGKTEKVVIIQVTK
jgi:hypothetical protein